MRRVEIVAASRSWFDEFRLIGADLRAGLDGLALRIDHIGSTSVPGLASKDVIDVQVTVAALDPDVLVPAFGRAGFRHRPDNAGYDHRPPGADGPEQDWAKLYFSPAPGKRAANIHVRVAGRPNSLWDALWAVTAALPGTVCCKTFGRTGRPSGGLFTVAVQGRCATRIACQAGVVYQLKWCRSTTYR